MQCFRNCTLSSITLVTDAESKGRGLVICFAARMSKQQCIAMFSMLLFLLFYRQHLSCDDCLENTRKYYQNCFVLYCALQLCTVMNTFTRAVLASECGSLIYVYLRVLRVFRNRGTMQVYLQV